MFIAHPAPFYKPNSIPLRTVWGSCSFDYADHGLSFTNGDMDNCDIIDKIYRNDTYTTWLMKPRSLFVRILGVEYNLPLESTPPVVLKNANSVTSVVTQNVTA